MLPNRLWVAFTFLVKSVPPPSVSVQSYLTVSVPVLLLFDVSKLLALLRSLVQFGFYRKVTCNLV